MSKDRPKKAKEPSVVSNKKHVTYTRREQAHDESEVKVSSSTSSCTVEKTPSSADVTCDSAEIKPESKDLSVNASADDYAIWEWCFDNAANVHMVSDRRYFVDYEPFDNDADCVRGFKKKFEATPVGHGTVQLVVKRGKLDVVLTLRDTFHVPDSINLLSHTEDQGYTVEYQGRSGSRMYELWNDEEKLLDVGNDKCQQAKSNKKLRAPMRQPRVNISAADGCAALQRWHERLGHLCPQFVKIMVDRDLVKGMMLHQRTFDGCEACNLWKERKLSAQNRLDRGIERKNEVIFADLLFPEPRTPSGNQKPVLVIMDGYTRYTTVYPLKSKEAPEVNPAMQRYIEWADRQFPAFKVTKVITDGGREFNNEEMTT
ncbi:Retrovirus-related pol Polyprotein, partial [Phytophthora palmivora]